MSARNLCRYLNFFFAGVFPGIFAHPTFAAAPLETWTTQQISTNWFALDTVVYGSGCFVASGTYSDYSVVLSSEDGLQWALRADGGYPNPLGAPVFGTVVHFSEGRFIAPGYWGSVAISTNGTNWAVVYAAHDLDFYGGTYGKGLYVAVGNLRSWYPEEGGVSNIMTSVNGTDWTFRQSHPIENHPIKSVAYGGGMFVAIGDNDGYVYTSPTGAEWTRRNIAGGNSIVYANSLFLVPLTAGTNMISADGLEWDSKPTGAGNLIDGISYSHGEFIARAGAALVISTNGTNWQQCAAAIPGWSLACDGTRLVTVSAVRTNYLYGNASIHTSARLAAIEIAGGHPPVLAVSGLPGRCYNVEFRQDLGSSAVGWSNLSTIQLTNSRQFVSDLIPPGIVRFYRVGLVP